MGKRFHSRGEGASAPGWGLQALIRRTGREGLCPSSSAWESSSGGNAKSHPGKQGMGRNQGAGVATLVAGPQGFSRAPSPPTPLAEGLVHRLRWRSQRCLLRLGGEKQKGPCRAGWPPGEASAPCTRPCVDRPGLGSQTFLRPILHFLADPA